MHSLIQDLRYAGRMLRCSPGFCVIAGLALAIGIGANTAVFTIVNAVLLRPLPYPHPERLLLLSEDPHKSHAASPLRLPDRDFVELRRYDRFFDGVAAFAACGTDMVGAGEPVHLAAASVTADFMRVLGVPPMMGRTFVAAEETSRVRTAVIGESLWRERFAADPEIVGRQIRLDGVVHTVIGVMPPGFAFPSDAQLWTPLEVRSDPHMGFARPVVGRLKNGASPRQAQTELQAVLGSRRVAVVQPFQELVVAGVREPLLIFVGAVALILLIACADIANLLLFRVASRGREIAVRAALGAGPRRLVQQLLTESTLLSLTSGCMGLLLAIWGVPVLLALAPQGMIPALADIHVDGRVLTFAFGVSLLAGLLMGAAPASHILRRPLPASLVGAEPIAGRARPGLRSLLVVAELALALVLLAGGGLMLKSFFRMRAADPGFRPDNVLTITVSLPEAVYRAPEARRDFERRLVEKLSGRPGVAAAGAVDLLPLGPIMLTGDIHADGGAIVHRGYQVDKPCVSPDYFRTMGIRLLDGRDFSYQDDLSAPEVAIVSQSVAREVWPGQNAIGKRVSMQDRPQPADWLIVVGVVEDVRQFGVTSGRRRAVYRPYSQATGPVFSNEITFVVRTAIDPLLIAPTILRHAVYEVDPNQPVASLATMQDLIGRDMAEPLFQTRLLAAFSILALLLAAIGIYGVLSFTVAARTHEIGIRMALGAPTRDVMLDVLRYTFTLAAAGVALGAAGAVAATRVLANLLFEVKPADPMVLLGVASLLASVAALAGWIPARRATRVDPVVALRYE
ncbi:MAG: ABC transporter permease [Bryobacteraceae bacterium]